MSPFGYTESQADEAKTKLDAELRSVNFHLDQISKAVPQAGAVTSRFEEAKEIIQEGVEDLHEEIDRRTDSAPVASGGSGAGLTALSLYGFDYWDEPGAGLAL